jgi:hypothetical protein
MSGKGPKGIPSGIAWTGQRALSSVTVLRFLVLDSILVSGLLMMLTGFAKATTSGRVLAGALTAALTCAATAAVSLRKCLYEKNMISNKGGMDMGWDGYGEGRRIWICFFFVKIYDIPV